MNQPDHSESAATTRLFRPPRDPAQLSHDQLAQIVRLAQQWLYLETSDTGEAQWNLDKEWQSVDVCCDLSSLLAEHDLIPQEP